MRYLVWGRARRNFGDHLIIERGIRLIKTIKGDAQLIIGDAGIPLDEQMTSADLANLDAIIIPGGPGIRSDAYPSLYPLSNKVFKYNIPLYFLGAGSKFYPYQSKTEKVRFSRDSLFFLNYISSFAPVGVRDNVTQRVLAKVDVPAVVNGCPAWYCLSEIDCEFNPLTSITSVVFSVPDGYQFCLPFISLLDEFKRAYPELRCIVSFNQGIFFPKNSNEYEKNLFIYSKAKSMGCEIIDMSGGCNNTEVYDQSTLHIGYRVHTHIYYISKGKPSFLIAEDSRGAGVLETLQTPGIILQLTRPIKGCRKLNSVLQKCRVNNSLRFSFYSFIAGVPNVNTEVIEMFRFEVERRFEGFRYVKEILRRYYNEFMEPYVKEAIP